MQESIAMSMTQCFEVERMNRAIEATADPAQLQTLAKQLLHAWQSSLVVATLCLVRVRLVLRLLPHLCFGSHLSDCGWDCP